MFLSLQKFIVHHMMALDYVFAVFKNSSDIFRINCARVMGVGLPIITVSSANFLKSKDSY